LEETLNHIATFSNAIEVGHLGFSILAPWNVWAASTIKNGRPQRIAIIALVSKDHLSCHVTKDSKCCGNVGLIAWHQVKGQRFSFPVGDGGELRVSSSLCLAKALVFRGFMEVTSILMNFDVGGIDHLATIRTNPSNVNLEQLREDSLLGPAKMEAVNRIPFPIPLWQLVPLRTSQQDPPNAIQSFTKIGRLASFL